MDDEGPKLNSYINFLAAIQLLPNTREALMDIASTVNNSNSLTEEAKKELNLAVIRAMEKKRK